MTDTAGDAPVPTSTWAPFRAAVFRSLWIATLVSNIGTWMQTVGAQWLLIGRPHAALLVSLVQTASLLPAVALSFVGGVLADTFDRRRLLVATQGLMGLTCVLLAALTDAHQMPPALLLTFTFVLGSGAALTAPAYQSLIPDTVARPQVPAAAALNSISVNMARAIGPAIAGVLIAHLGVGAVFGIDAATFFYFAGTAIALRNRLGRGPEDPERFFAALRAGGRYVRYSPVVRRVLVRAAVFLVPASALWALLPIVASRRLGLGASGYGLLLGALGVGAILGAVVLGRLRAAFGPNTLIAGASAVYGAGVAVLAVVRISGLVVVALLPAGLAWMVLLSTVNASLQLFLPTWVRARGLAAYQVVLFGAQAVGAALWGVVAATAGVPTTLLVAAGLLVSGAASLRRIPYPNTAGMDRQSAAYWPEPVLAMPVDPVSGPVVVQVAFTVTANDEAAFLVAMANVRRSRLRTGALRWGLYRDLERPERFVELFIVASWEEHLRQHSDRQTGTDRDFEQAAVALSTPPPTTTHYLAAKLGGS